MQSTEKRIAASETQLRSEIADQRTQINTLFSNEMNSVKSSVAELKTPFEATNNDQNKAHDDEETLSSRQFPLICIPQIPVVVTGLAKSSLFVTLNACFCHKNKYLSL